MNHRYTSYISAKCACDSGKGRWAALNCPAHAKWTAAISGKAPCKTITKLYLLAALAALDDFTTRCEVTLVVDDLGAMGVLEEIGEGLSPRVGCPSIVQALDAQFDRHRVTLVYRSRDDDPRWAEVIENLKG